MNPDEPRPGAPDDDDEGSPSLSALLGGRASLDEPEPPPDLLRGVQKRIRERSRGKFYRDGWSRSGVSASTLVTTSALMLALLGLVYWLLAPGGPLASP